MKQILTVTELTRNIQFLLESSFDLVWIEGEISNLRRPGSGHIYFTLKDAKSQIRAVAFRQTLRTLRFSLEDGMRVVCRATLNVYEQRGEYQLVIDVVEPRGVGALQMAFEQLKARLQEEGLFEPGRKRPIPFLAERIGVVTSASGAVIRDILNITGRRFPSMDLLIAPVRVQGAEAAAEIVRALDDLNTLPDIDVIILARGGGSLEDLAPFNDESVARAIFRSTIPVVSAIGHEVDFTIADFVADVRAPTPSAAAELIAPLRRDLKLALADLVDRTRKRVRLAVEQRRSSLDSFRERLKDPGRLIDDKRLHLDARTEQLVAAVSRILEIRKREHMNRRDHLYYVSPAGKIKDQRSATEHAAANLHAVFDRCRIALKNRLDHDMTVLGNLSPFEVLRRGYSIVRKLPEGSVLRDATSVETGTDIEIRLSSGGLTAKVTNIQG
jgi:exodeoxyribonuclease VII large subunit